MNSSLTRPQSIQGLYKTYFSFANKFHFTDLLRNYIQSEEWKDKSQEQVWGILSRISDDIGAMLTDDIVNYTRNVVDINTCKVPELIEHAKMLSYGLDNIKNSYEFFPKHVQVLVDLFSINPEYLIGNHQNHILSDEVIKEILIYIRDNTKDRTPFTNSDAVDRLIDDPHGLTNAQTYRNFVQMLFYTSLVQALTQPYSYDGGSDGQPIAFNVLWKERQNQNNVLSRIDEYKSWVDKYIWNEIEHPLNDSGLANTLYSQVEMVKNQKQMSSKFNPFKVADHIYFNGLNPTNSLSSDELSLVETVLDYHSRTKYDYERQQFVDDMTTQYAYYKELEFCEWVKLVMFVMNNIQSFSMTGLTYDISSNKFIQTGVDANCLRVVNIFNEGNKYVVQNSAGKVALNHNILLTVSKFLCDYVFHIQAIRENVKTIAQKHAMRGTGALLVHIVNDYLIKELPVVRNMMVDSIRENDDDDIAVKRMLKKKLKFTWETDQQFNNYGNVKVLEYEDDNEYFNIEPVKDVRFTERTNARYWEQLEGMGYGDTLGVLTKGQIKDFYRNVLGIGRLQPKKSKDYDDIVDFLVDLFKIGANPVSWDSEEEEIQNPIDDIINKSEEDYGYTKDERLDVQTNTELRKNQEKQFKEYSGNEDFVGNGIYDLVNNKLFYWKNMDFSSHVLHPFMYNLKLWNKLNNIIINGYKDYINNDLVDYLSSKTKFDELFGKFGESMNFWKYNVMDLTGYTTRYEAAIKDEHKDDFNKTTSELTGYDGLFYPKAVQEFVELYDSENGDFSLLNEFFTGDVRVYGHSDNCYWADGDSKDSNDAQIGVEHCFIKGEHDFIAQIYSVYWQLEKTTFIKKVDGKSDRYRKVEEDSFYTRWYSHLNYTRTEYQKIAIQLWYWRERIRELATIEYPITRYCLDIQNNSLILVSSFGEGAEGSNPFLIDLAIAQNDVQQNRSGNANTHSSFCDNPLKKPSELWIRWKSNPIALPAFDVYYDQQVGDSEFDLRYRTNSAIELGQLTHTNNDCNENFKVVISKWREKYANIIDWDIRIAHMDYGTDEEGVDIERNKPIRNRLPVFFDMEQSANVIALASWFVVPDVDENGIVKRDPYAIEKDAEVVCCAKNPYHIVSIERTGTDLSDYNYTEYGSNSMINGSGVLMDWMFDAYQYCHANGSILIPFYRFDCSDENREEFRQKVSLRLFIIAAQQLKQDNYVTSDRIVKIDIGNPAIDLNDTVDFHGKKRKYRFDHPVRVCRNTNLVFSTYEKNGMNRLKCAFLGTFVKNDVELQCDNGDGTTGKVIEDSDNTYQTTSIKRSSCDAKTRYEYDSMSIPELARTKGMHYKGTNVDWAGVNGDNQGTRMYVDTNILLGSKGDEDDPEDDLPPSYNSYDSMDKFVFVLDFEPSIDSKSMFDISWRNGLSMYSYNVLSDAGCIPHFAYQSLIKYTHGTGELDKDGGTAYTWKNEYLNNKTHMQFELLGLDDQTIPKVYENMQRMIVDDITDGVKTLICPTKFMDDIYRIWCETEDVKTSMYFEEYGKYENHFRNEYRDYTNPDLFYHEDGAGGFAIWDMWEEDDDGEIDISSVFELDLPKSDGEIDLDPTLSDEEKEQKKMDAFKALLDEYYVCIVRSENGNILNEKRYILQPTPISQFVFGMGDEDGYMKCNLSPYQTSLVQDNHFVPTQVIFTGTQNPFNYDNDGNRTYSKPEELQYGNCVKGVDEIGIKIDIITRESEVNTYDETGYIIYEPTGELDPSGKPYEVPVKKKVTRKFLVPKMRLTRNGRAKSGISLIDMIQRDAQKIDAGQITVIFSHKNMDNIAKYHILNRSSSIYFDGSLPKNGENQYKYSDFKFSDTVKLVYDGGRWKSADDNGATLNFTTNQVKGANGTNAKPLPPYYLAGSDGKPTWFLQQDRWDWKGQATAKFSPRERLPFVDEFGGHDWNCHPAVIGNTQQVKYAVPERRNFIYAHKVKEKAEKYLDYLYIKNGGLAFKVNEESHSFADAMTKIPPFYVDIVTRNKMADLNDIQVLTDYSTFIHQSENPDAVKNCGTFNPLFTEAVLKYGEEMRELHTGVFNPQAYDDDQILVDMGMMTGVVQNNQPNTVITTEPYRRNASGNVESCQRKVIKLDNFTTKTRLSLQLEDGEVDDYLKIYTNYVRKDAGNGDWYYDLYFNIQNLFNSPFEYISSVTKQPNVLILEDSYLCLTGDKFHQVWDEETHTYHNEIDKDKVDKIKKGGELTIYGQIKTYSDDKLSDVRTIKLFTYRIYNISDDKPKFLIEKIYDITKSSLQNNVKNKIKIDFSDVLWTLDESKFKFFDENVEPVDTTKFTDKYKVLNQDVVVVQPVNIRYNWNKDDDYRIRSISFDIMNDIIDFNNVPELCPYSKQARTLRNGELVEATIVNRATGREETVKIADMPYYDHWSDRYMKLTRNEVNGIYNLTLTYDEDMGFNFETIYLRWRLPKGCKIMDTLDRLGGYVFSATASNIVVEGNNSNMTPIVDVNSGHVVVRAHKPGKMYLGLEHSTTMRKSGYVLVGLADAIRNALNKGEKNPTVILGAIAEDEILDEVSEKMANSGLISLPAPANDQK